MEHTVTLHTKLTNFFPFFVNIKPWLIRIACLFSVRLSYVNITSMFIDDFRAFQCRKALYFVPYLLNSAPKHFHRILFFCSKQKSIYLMQFCRRLNCPLREKKPATYLYLVPLQNNTYGVFFFFWRCSPTRSMASFAKFLDHTQRRTTVGRTPLDEWSARRRYLYLTTHSTHNRKTSMPHGGIRNPQSLQARGRRPTP